MDDQERITLEPNKLSLRRSTGATMPNKVQRPASKKAKRAKTPGDIILEPTYVETMSPRDYVEYMTRESHNIASVRIVAPVLGEKGFGRIVVRRNSPLFTYTGVGTGRRK
jgi:hypothetical protein